MPAQDSDHSLLALELELKQERASAYFSITKKMENALREFYNFDREHAGNELHQEQIRRRTALLQAAGERVFFFLIQREAMRLPYYEELFEDFGISTEVRKNIGPRQQKK